MSFSLFHKEVLARLKLPGKRKERTNNPNNLPRLSPRSWQSTAVSIALSLSSLSFQRLRKNLWEDQKEKFLEGRTIQAPVSGAGQGPLPMSRAWSQLNS